MADALTPSATAALTPAVLLVVRGPESDPRRSELARLLGAERYVALERLLVRRALEWAEEIAPGRIDVACKPPEAVAAVRSLVGDRGPVWPLQGEGMSTSLSSAVERVFAARGGPVFTLWPELPRWRATHAQGALADLSDGCDVSVGPVFDGGFYLLALARPVPELFSLPDTAWTSPEAMGRALAAVHEAGLEAGLLRAERGLHRAADVRAVLADPLVDDELRAVLRG